MHDPATAFLDGGRRAAELIRARDWSGHPLGLPAHWPSALKTALSLVVNSPESMILCWGPELTFFFNDTYFPLLGPRLDWAMGARFDEVWADALDQAMPIVRAAFAGYSRRFTNLPWKLDTDRGVADTWWSFSYSRVLDEKGEVAGLFILTTETTERVLADRALAASQAELGALNDSLERQVEERTAERDRMWASSPDLLVVVDPQGVIERANPAWAVILGYDPDALRGTHIFDLVHPDDRAPTEQALVQAFDAPLLSFENRYRHADGGDRWIAWVAAAGAGSVYATGRHVTAQKEAEAALRQAEELLRQSQKVEAVGQLTGGVAHDFNNLLTVIRGSVELLRRPGLSEERRIRYTDAIADTADRAARLTSQLLAFARRQSLSPELIDACASLSALRDMLGTLAGSRIAIVMDLADCPALVNADRSQFDTAIVNMAVNARDAMSGEGTLTIRVGPAERVPAIRSHLAVEGDYVGISLIDTGAGIAPAEIDRIFEPFFTTKAVGEGTGLGLSQVFGFAKQSGGEIVVDSREGEGSTFTLYLPRVREGAPAAISPRAAEPAASAGGLRVLAVEDNAEVGAFAVQALEELGYETILATSGEAALAELAANGGSIDIVFSDVVMPGMSGIDLAREIDRLHPGKRVILTSGFSDVLAQQGPRGFDLVQKPYSIAQLAAALDCAAATLER